MRFTLAAMGVGLVLSVCTSNGDSGALRALSAPLRAEARVASVVLDNVPQSRSQAFKADFERHVQERLSRCSGQGGTPLTLSVALDGFDAPNPALALFAPTKSEISGVARLRDANGAVVGEYRIQRSLMIGGVAGAVAAGMAERNMSLAFGEEVCRQAFGDRDL